MPIDPKKVKWDPIEKNAIQWDNAFQGGQTRPFEKLSPKQTFQGELRPLFMQPPGGEGSFAKPSPVKDVIQELAAIAGDIGMSSAAGLYQAFVGFILVLGTNLIVKKFDDEKALF